MFVKELLWKLTRLRTMDAREIFYRVRQEILAQFEKYGLGLAKLSEPIGEIGLPWLAELPASFDSTLYRKTSDQILLGYLNIFSLNPAELGFPPHWNRDPKTKIEAPMTFGKSLNYRNEALVGDIKYLWEPNRHSELVTLAQTWHLTGNEKYADGCRVMLNSWFDQCPYPLGVNWTSSLEHAVRLVNWAIAWHLLRASPIFSGQSGMAFRRRWLDSVYQHCHFISGNFSRYSSANNHFLGELMGLFIASITWPLWRESSDWQAHAAQKLETEALKQNTSDGVNQEQAIWYQHEVVDMLLLCGLTGRANGVEFSERYWNRIEVMLEFIASVMDVGGNVPMIGDADDAMMVRWVVSDVFNPSFKKDEGSQSFDRFNVYRSLLATGAVLFKREDFKIKAGQFDLKSRWLLGDIAEKTFDMLLMEDSQLPIRTAFPDGGYYILGNGFETPTEVRIVSDAGPLGYLSIAAHGHADALSFTLSASGRELLIDPGTYSYHTQNKWRNYFRGTSAHNTIRIDKLDQSIAGGNFLWTSHARAYCKVFNQGIEQDTLVASHDGYQRLTDPVIHRRELSYNKLIRVLTVTDTIDCCKSHEVEIFWHFAEDCEVRTEGGEVLARHEDVVLRMTMSDSVWQPELIVGQEDPPLGWISRQFDVKISSCSVAWRSVIHGTTSLKTTIRLC
jgi:hypothetical protein